MKSATNPQPLQIQHPLPYYSSQLNLPSSAHQLSQFPSQFNPKDKNQLLDLSKQFQRVSYQGPGKSDSDAAAVRSNHPIPSAVGIYYFEVHIASKGRDGYIGIGFCAQSVSLQRLPGWEPMSWGYHGDDGHSFNCNGSGKTYGPSFTTGDVIGCGIDFHKNSAFFTKNGLFLGYAFQNLPLSREKLFPVVGLRTPGEIVDVNFGLAKSAPFIFNIEYYVADQIDNIEALELSSVPIAPGTANQLVLKHLLYSGYLSTAEIFASAVGLEIGKEESERCRLKLRLKSLLVDGEYEDLLTLIRKEFAFLDRSHLLFFFIKCQKFVDLVAEIYRRNSSADELGDEQMQIDSHPTDSLDEYELLKVSLEYGQSLQLEYGPDERLVVQQKLIEVFSILAYPDPFSSPSAHVFSPDRKLALFDMINSTLFGGDDVLGGGCVRQLETVLAEMCSSGLGSAALIRSPLSNLDKAI